MLKLKNLHVSDGCMTYDGKIAKYYVYQHKSNYDLVVDPKDDDLTEIGYTCGGLGTIMESIRDYEDGKPL